MTLVAATLAVALTHAAPAAAATSPAAESTLTVTGVGVVSRPPDQAAIAVSLVTSDDVAARALSANNARYNDLVAKVSAAGVPAASVRTTSLSTYFNPRPQQPDTNVAQRYGYIVSRYLRITIQRIDTAGAVVDAVTAAGATNVDGVSYGFRDPRAASRAAQAAAMTDAMEQARAIAEAAHLRIVRVRAIATEGNRSPAPPAPLAMRALSAAPSVPTVLPSAELETRATLTVTYVLAG